ncbi:MAG: matrixin family metalloprotease [Thermoplasmata archaeon]|nr:matrixin family metalloprotease [Thermoplasmata archaeon]
MQSLVEFDIQFNGYYLWGDNPSHTNGMDLQGIAAHELGHAVGLGDVYSDTCIDVTMYGYASDNGYNKRTLEQQDINGILELYG